MKCEICNKDLVKDGSYLLNDRVCLAHLGFITVTSTAQINSTIPSLIDFDSLKKLKEKQNEKV